VEINEQGTRFKIDEMSFVLPWRGDEFCQGWLEIWQYLREKGLCTTRDIERLGFTHPEPILRLLLSLDYLQELTFSHKGISLAVQLKPVALDIQNYDLFQQESRITQIIGH
jgi:hypothetical protein